MKKKKYLIVTSGNVPFSYTEGGAVEHLLYSLISENNNEVEITVFSSNPLKLDNNFNFNPSVKIIYFNTTNLFFKIKQGFDYVYNSIFQYKGNTFSKKIKRYVKNNFEEYMHYDAVIVENKPEFIIALKETGLNIPFILHLHNNYLDKYPIQYFENYNHIITVSNYLTNEFLRLGFDNVTTIQNGIDLEIFEKFTFPKEITEINKVKIMYSGRLTKEKGIHYLVEAVNELNCDQIELYVCGDGSDKRFVSYLKSFSRLEKTKIIFTGVLNKQELMKYYQDCNVGVVPSVNKEAFGLSALEHLAAGNLLVTTGVGGLKEVVSEDSSLIISSDETSIKESLKKILIELVDNKKIIVVKGANGRQQAKKFSNKLFVSNFFNTVNIISERSKK